MSIADLENLELFYNASDKLSNNIINRFEKRFEEAEQKRNQIKTKEDLKAHVDCAKKKFIENLGGIPYDGTLPLNSKVTGVIEEDDLVIEKVLFESRPKVYVTANLYLPKKRKDPCGAVLLQMGHSPTGKMRDRYQCVARAIASAGLIVLATDPPGQGERLNYYSEEKGESLIGGPTYEHQHAGEQCVLLGDNAARYFICDAMRSVDYLISRPEVDKNNIGATGCSGGGTMTSCLMFVDERIKAAAPAAFLTTRRDILYSGCPQDSEQIWRGAATYGMDHYEILMGFAPKALLLLTMDSDFFPIEGSIELYKTCKRFWEMSGKGDKLNITIDQSLHSYPDNLALEAAEFFARELNSENRIGQREKIKFLPDEELWCTKKGQLKATYDDLKYIFDENKERFESLEKPLKPLKEFLLEKMNFEREPVKIMMRSLTVERKDGFVIRPYLWFSQKQMPNFAFLFSNEEDVPKDIVICLWDGGTNKILENINDIKEICNQDKGAFVLDLTAMGKVLPDLQNDVDINEKHGTIDKMAKDLLWLGDSLCAMRLFDLNQIFEFIKEKFRCEPKVYAKGLFAHVARLYKKVNCDAEIILSDPAPDFDEIVKSRFYNDEQIFAFSIPEILKYL